MESRNRASPASVEARYKVLLDVGRILTATLEPEELYSTIHRQAQRVLEMSGFSIALYDDGLDTLTVVYKAVRGVVQPAGRQFPGSSIAAVRDVQPQLTCDAQETLECLASSDGNFCGITAPLVLNDRVTGVLCACLDGQQGYGEADIELLAAIADHAAVALGNAHFLQDRERRQREAERLEEIGRALTASLDLPKVLERIVRAALELTHADSATVWLTRNEREVEVAMTAGKIAPPRGLVFPIPAQLTEQGLSGQPFVFEQLKRADTILPDYMRNLTEAESTMAVALNAEGELLGALSIGHRRQRRYTTDEVRLLQRLSLHASIAVANARLHEQILALSLTDPLTGLPNRRHLEMFLEKEFAAARRGRRLTLMLFDLDNFKEYNDRHGHQAGDETLRAFANVLQQQTRAMNLAARYGGDEFISILADTDRRGGVTHATRISRAIAADPMLAAAGIRVSAGIATYSARMIEPADLIRAADRDLYARKSGKAREVRT